MAFVVMADLKEIDLDMPFVDMGVEQYVLVEI